MLSVGVQGVSSNLQSDRYSGSDSSTANSAVQQSRGATLLTQQLECYLTTSPQLLDEGTQHDDKKAVSVVQTRPCAMTAIKVESERAKAERHYAQVLDLVTDTFDKIPL